MDERDKAIKNLTKASKDKLLTRAQRIGMKVMADNLKFERDVLGKPYNPKEFSP